MSTSENQPQNFRVTRELVIRRRQLPHWQVGAASTSLPFVPGAVLFRLRRCARCALTFFTTMASDTI
jgi:hypothetical protein